MSDNKSVKYVIRQMQECDLDQVRQLWSIFKYMHSVYDNEVIMKVDAQGLFVAQDLETGKIKIINWID